MALRRILISGLIAGAALLILSYLSLYAMVYLFPEVAEQYYNPVFSLEGEKTVPYFLHPFVLGMALSWFWERFKGMFPGGMLKRGLELGVVYGLVATLPAMWIIYSSLNLSFSQVLSWFGYGVLQATVAGLLFARLNP